MYNRVVIVLTLMAVHSQPSLHVTNENAQGVTVAGSRIPRAMRTPPPDASLAPPVSAALQTTLASAAPGALPAPSALVLPTAVGSQVPSGPVSLFEYGAVDNDLTVTKVHTAMYCIPAGIPSMSYEY
jgi:hypothetical protein